MTGKEFKAPITLKMALSPSSFNPGPELSKAQYKEVEEILSKQHEDIKKMIASLSTEVKSIKDSVDNLRIKNAFYSGAIALFVSGISFLGFKFSN